MNMKKCDTEIASSTPSPNAFVRAVILGFAGALVTATSLIVLGYDLIMYVKNLFQKILKKVSGAFSSR